MIAKGLCRFVVAFHSATSEAWFQAGAKTLKTCAPLMCSRLGNSSGSGALFMIEVRDDAVAASVPVPVLDGLGIDDQEVVGFD